MKYINKETGITFESECLIRGGAWEPVNEPAPEPKLDDVSAPPEPKGEEKKKTAKKGGKKK